MISDLISALCVGACCSKDSRKWEVFAANYSFLQLNLTVPGASRLAVEAGEEELLQFLSKPVIFSLSINNRSTSLDNTSQPVRIKFQHNGVSFTAVLNLRDRSEWEI